MVEKGSGGRVSLVWEPCERNLEGCSLAGDPEGWASISIGTPLRNLEMGSSTRDFERWMKEVLGMGRLSVKRLSADGL